ncbi:degradation of aromatic compounds [Zychaea mexicana]|uniref:degradation of aromatic compounds n=1 Tax=Zychaea mexicana TaxID=64656 RepID=UPI0022FE7BA2|nr:degradation of aromatic compounds [Zychaea mexicana]KAI9497288.1 degradation of aromatic compounds [Zychaea mexicana]
MSPVWNRLIRFVAADSKVYFGEPIVSGDATVDKLLEAGSLEAKVVTGDVFADDAVVTDQVVKVTSLLAPLSKDQIPIIKCVGLNYKAHIAEGGRTPPPYPSIFIKPSHSLADAFEDIPIPKLAHETLDYEGELTIVIGKTGKDIPIEKVGEYVAGYTVANDVSCRKWQRDPKYAGGVPQWCFSKGFDKFAPIGPAIVSQKVLGDRPALDLTTRVNGEVRQSTNTSDLLFHVPEIVSFISQGTTLEKGTIIMTGTPAGVAMGMKNPLWLNNGDVVEVEIASIGKVSNKMAYA